MKKFVVKLPFLKKSTRIAEISKAKFSDRKDSKKIKETSKERTRKYRLNLKNNQRKLDILKQNKKIQNQAHKTKLKERRTLNTQFNKQYKEKQRQWQKNSRKRKKDKKEVGLNKDLESNQKIENRPVNVSDSGSSLRKRAQRTKKQLPQSPNAWASTLKHIIKNATPRRKGLLDWNINDENIDEVLNITKVGRPQKSVEKAKRSLAFAENTLPNAIWTKKSLYQYKRRTKKTQVKRITKPEAVRRQWESKIESFLETNSRVMPNKKDTLLINGERVAKRHLLCSKHEAFRKFVSEQPEFPRKFSTFSKMIPKNFKLLNLSRRQVCICTKDYNLEQKINSLNRLAILHESNTRLSVKQLSDLSVCSYDGKFPERKCVDRNCNNCGIESIINWYEPLLTASGPDQIVKYHQWETTTEHYKDKKGIQKKSTRWIQAEKKLPVEDVVKEISEGMKTFTGHMFRANYQQKVQNSIIEDMPHDHCVVVMDFSENMSLQSQDEIESAHWNIRQVTIHPIYIVRHSVDSTYDNPKLQKESLIVISDSLTHDSNAVQVFTYKLIAHLRNNPGPCPINVIHRFSDNCAAQYKNKVAFYNLTLLEETHDIRVMYHFTESGHGKGPSDGLGAAIKGRISRLILAGNVINNAYQVYLALQRNKSENIIQKIVYVPKRVIDQLKPDKPTMIKPLKGTQSFHCIRTFKKGSKLLLCSDLSCSCSVCIDSNQQGPCPLIQFRKDDILMDLTTGKRLLRADAESNDHESPSTPQCNTNPVDVVSSDLDIAVAESIVLFVNQADSNDEMIKAFEEKIHMKGVKLRGETPSDGNCLFWAISDQMDRINKNVYTHTQLRRMVVDHIQNLSDDEKSELAKFIPDDDLPTYLQKMADTGTYGDHICLEKLANILECKIRVVHADTQDVFIGNKEDTLLLGFIPELQHYTSLEFRFQSDDYVAVRLEDQRRKKSLHIAKVIQIDSKTDEVQLQYLRKDGLEDGRYKWPAKKDFSWESASNIINVFMGPVILPGRGLSLKFNTNEIMLCNEQL